MAITTKYNWSRFSVEKQDSLLKLIILSIAAILGKQCFSENCVTEIITFYTFYFSFNLLK